MSLLEANKGKKVRIAQLPTGKVRSSLIRLGLNEGDQVECLERLPGGTVVVGKNRQQIAIGARLARHIWVVPVGSE